MPSLHQEPSSSPALPIKSERIILTISDSLNRLHGQAMPACYQEIETAVEQLVQLGMKISAYPQAIEVQGKLHSLTTAVPPAEAMNSIINNQLIRNMRDIAYLRCDNAHLSLFVALVDGWLRSCEEYVRRHSSKRFADDILGVESAQRELIAVATRHVNKSYHFDNLLHLFDNLGLTKS